MEQAEGEIYVFFITCRFQQVLLYENFLAVDDVEALGGTLYASSAEVIHVYLVRLSFLNAFNACHVTFVEAPSTLPTKRAQPCVDTLATPMTVC